MAGRCNKNHIAFNEKSDKPNNKSLNYSTFMPLPKPIHPNKQAFIEGTSLILKNWTALQIAVTQGWGGPDSSEKRDWILDVMVDTFDKKGSKIDEDYIDDLLLQIMSDEFNCVLEDDSDRSVLDALKSTSTKNSQSTSNSLNTSIFQDSSSSDSTAKQVLLRLNEDKKFIIEDLDETHLFVETSAVETLIHSLESILDENTFKIDVLVE
ncbi:hypothetical protein BB561_002814 [Smittium simulii]|uniref:RNA polymerase II transcription factor B subunit 5 n=1 Tax=Smittium simulii TaxID=133385 RepID=A0A2T9YP17_9FUNG|nr:hypothetical protein BB561_002814 [Smittium simulii]